MPKKQTTDLTVQVIHDMFQIKGGGERLVKALCQGLPADLLTASIGKETFELNDLVGQVTNLDALSQINGIKTWSLARAFKRYKPQYRHYKNIIYSGVAAPLAIKHHVNARHIFYCHTPPRFVYDKRDHYLKELTLLSRPVLKALIHWFKPQYEQAVKQMDQVLTNSRYVQQRIKDNLGMDAAVVYPPCDTQHFKWHQQDNYYLSLARHDDLKRIDQIITAFQQMPEKKLIIASGGSTTENLKVMAQNHPNISFTGWLDEPALMKLIGSCIATIYLPKDEDFGMSPVESMSAGKPVFCSDHGGLLESVIDGATGFYIDEKNLAADLVEKINRYSPIQINHMRADCEAQAKCFDTQNFIKNFQSFL